MDEEKSQALGPAETPLHVVNRVVVSTQSFKYQYKYQYLSLKYQYQYQYPCLKYKYTSTSTSVPSTSTSTTDQVPVQVPSTTTLVVNVRYLGFCEICRVAERGASDQRAATLRPSVWRNPADHRRSVTGHIHCHGGLHRSPSRLHRYTAVSIRIIDTSLVGGVA